MRNANRPQPYTDDVETIPADEADDIQRVIQAMELILARTQAKSGQFRADDHVKSHGYWDHSVEPIRCDRVRPAVGRVPNTAGLGLESVGVQPAANGEIPVDDGFAAFAEGLYAIGDCIRGPKLAHKASEEGIACVERIVTGHG